MLSVSVSVSCILQTVFNLNFKKSLAINIIVYIILCANHHDITKILLKVALNTIPLTPTLCASFFSVVLFYRVQMKLSQICRHYQKTPQIMLNHMKIS